MYTFHIGVFTHFRQDKLSKHNILEETNFNFRYARLCNLDIHREKWLNCLQTLETLIDLQHLIWVCTVCQLPFWGLHTKMG